MITKLRWIMHLVCCRCAREGFYNQNNQGLFFATRARAGSMGFQLWAGNLIAVSVGMVSC
jgi:hypothetical protein